MKVYCISFPVGINISSDTDKYKSKSDNDAVMLRYQLKECWSMDERI